MDALDELNNHIEALCAIAERERSRVLDAMYSMTVTRGEVAELALDYATWTRTLEGYRALLRRAEQPVVVEK